MSPLISTCPTHSYLPQTSPRRGGQRCFEGRVAPTHPLKLLPSLSFGHGPWGDRARDRARGRVRGRARVGCGWLRRVGAYRNPPAIITTTIAHEHAPRGQTDHGLQCYESIHTLGACTGTRASTGTRARANTGTRARAPWEQTAVGICGVRTDFGIRAGGGGAGASPWRGCV